MLVLVIEVVISLPWCRSLKDKRKVRQGLIDRLERRHRISVKEVDCQDQWQTLCLGIAAVVISESGGRQLEASIRRAVEEHSNGQIREWRAELI